MFIKLQWYGVLESSIPQILLVHSKAKLGRKKDGKVVVLAARSLESKSCN